MNNFNKKNKVVYTVENICSITKYYDIEKLKIFSVCLYYNNGTKENTEIIEKIENYNNNLSELNKNDIDSLRINTSYLSYLKGLLQSLEDLVMFGNNEYEVRLYVDSVYEYISNLNLENLLNLINGDYNKDELTFRYIYSFLQNLKKYEFLSIHVFNCNNYWGKNFGMFIRTLPFYENGLEEIHIRDTDSSFGNLGDLYVINKWRSNVNIHEKKNITYSVSNYTPSHIIEVFNEIRLNPNHELKQIFDDYEFNLDFKSNIEFTAKLLDSKIFVPILNSIGGLPFNIFMENELIKKIKSSMFNFCFKGNEHCKYGADELFYTIIYKYLNMYNINLNVSLDEKYKDYIGGSIHNLCPINKNYIKFYNLMGLNSYILRYVSNDVFLSDNIAVSLMIIFVVLFNSIVDLVDIIKISMLDKDISKIMYYINKINYEYLKYIESVNFIFEYMNRYIKIQKSPLEITNIILYLHINNKKNLNTFSKEFISKLELSENRKKFLVDFFYSSSLRIIYPNFVGYNDLYKVGLDSIYINNYHLENANFFGNLIIVQNDIIHINKKYYLNSLILNDEKYFIIDLMKENVFLIYNNNSKSKYILKFASNLNDKSIENLKIINNKLKEVINCQRIEDNGIITIKNSINLKSITYNSNISCSRILDSFLNKSNIILYSNIEGKPLHKFFKILPSTTYFFINIISQLLNIIYTLHNKDIIHTDLHEDNLIVYYDNYSKNITLKIIDFENSRLISKLSKSNYLNPYISINFGKYSDKLNLSYKSLISDIQLITDNKKNVLKTGGYYDYAPVPHRTKNIFLRNSIMWDDSYSIFFKLIDYIYVCICIDNIILHITENYPLLLSDENCIIFKKAIKLNNNLMSLFDLYNTNYTNKFNGKNIFTYLADESNNFINNLIELFNI